MNGAPHRIVDGIATGLIDSVRGVGNSVTGSVKGAGEKIMRALDEPFSAVTDKEGPHRVAHRLANGLIDAGVNFVDKGIVGSTKMAGEAVMRALDHVPEQTGIPPQLPTLRK